MSRIVTEERVWDLKDESGDPLLFSPVLAKKAEWDIGTPIHPKAAFKVVNIIENSNLVYMFGGFEKLLDQAGLEFSDLGPGEAFLFLNHKRTYMKLLVGNGTLSPVIIAYRLPSGMRIPAHAVREIARSLLKRGDVQMDDRLKVAMGETLSEMRKRVYGDEEDDNDD